MYKRSLSIILALTVVICAALCGCSRADTPEAPVTDAPAQESDNPNAVFEGTCWHITCGPTNGSNYLAKFSLDGTFVTVGVGSLQLCDGSYTYDGSSLYITLPCTFLDNTEFTASGDGFASVEEFVAQQYYNYHCTMEPISEQEFNETYEPIYRREAATQKIIDLLGEYLTVAASIADGDITHAETIYGSATELKDEPNWARFTFENAPVKFEIEYYLAEPDRGTINFNLSDMNLSSDDRAALLSACAVAFESSDRIYADVEGSSGTKRCTVCINGFENGSFTDYGGFSIFITKSAI